MRGAAASMCGLLLFACTIKNTDTNGGTGGTGQGDAGPGTGGDGGAAGASKSRNCQAVVQCAIACADADSACRNACLASGTDDGQAKAIALSNCLGANSCADSACVQSKCATELNACLVTPAPTGGQPITGAPPPGSVPSDFVGTWKRTTYTGADDFTFNADGTASRKQIEVSSFAGCSNTVAFEYAGTVVFTPAHDGFTFYITTATNTSSACGQSSSSAGTTGAFDFTIEPIPALGPGKDWFFNVQGCPVTAEVDKRIQCGGEYDLK